MIRYAISTSSLGKFFTESILDAFRNCRLKNVEAVLCAEPPESPYRHSLALMHRACEEGEIHSLSVHMPFYGLEMRWDPSSPEEEVRRDVVRRMREMIRDNATLLRGGNLTLHASNEPPPEEHPRRIGQIRRSLEELLPSAEELDFSINVEFLPRTCVGNCEEELERILDGFPERYTGICFDLNHVMARSRELPEIIRRLAPKIKTVHVSDYDGVDEMHWFPGQGVIPWDRVMSALREIPRDVLLISETVNQLGTKVSHVASPYFGLRQTEKAIFFLERCSELMPEEEKFHIPGN